MCQVHRSAFMRVLDLVLQALFIASASNCNTRGTLNSEAGAPFCSRANARSLVIFPLSEGGSCFTAAKVSSWLTSVIYHVTRSSRTVPADDNAPQVIDERERVTESVGKHEAIIEFF
jgi:hypothetical protein